MDRLRRVVLLRHGETDGLSSQRYHGASDVALSEAGREQMRRCARALRGQAFELVVASTLSRSWESARIVAGGAPVRLDARLREIDFGRWEGRTAAEIADLDPVLHADWRRDPSLFDFPGGERRAAFRARVLDAFESVCTSGASSALLVIHKGPIRLIAEHLLGAPLEAGAPELASAIDLSRGASGWYRGLRGSNPPDLAAA